MKVIWNLTRLCSWNCLICCVSAIHVSNKQKDEAHKNMVYTGKELKLSDKMKIIDDLYNNDIESIDFSGGDLLLIDENIQLVKYAATKFQKESLSISVPGTGFNPELINSLRDCISKIEFTLDSIEDDRDSSRPKGYVGVAKHAIKLCNKENIDVSVSTVLKRSNCSQNGLSKIYNFLIENNVKEWEILPYYQVGRATDIYALIPDEDKFTFAIQFINELMQEGFINISYQHSLENKINGSVKCNALNRSIGILSDGMVTSCAWGLGYDGSPVDDKFVIGYMPKQKLKDILNSEKAIEWNKNKYRNGIAICQVEEIMANKQTLVVDKKRKVM